MVCNIRFAFWVLAIANGVEFNFANGFHVLSWYIRLL